MPDPRRALALLASLSPLVVLLLVLSPARLVRAAPATNNVVVGDGMHPDTCNMFSLAQPMNNFADASITFQCGGPATIVITQSGGLNVLSGRSFTINGGDAITITGLDAYRLFYVQAGGALTLTHILLTHGFDIEGGAVLNDGAYLSLDHVTLRANQASKDDGGAIASKSGAVTRLTNSLVISNSAKLIGGAIEAQIGAFTATNTTFRDNYSPNCGALDLRDAALISGGQIVSNTADEIGGAICVTPLSHVSLDGVQLNGNRTLTTTGLSQGGGAIYNFGGALTVTNSSLTHNHSVYAGALDNKAGSVYLANDTLSGNATSGPGGALSNHAGGVVMVHDSTFTLNSAESGGALHNNDAASDLELYHTAVLQNTAAVLGGGIYVENGFVSLRDQSSLSGNSAQAGGGLYSKAGGHPLLFDALVEDNQATNENGGGLYLEAGSVGGVHNTLLQGNTATGAGGAIDNESNNFNVIGSTFNGNFAAFGAGLYTAGSDVSILGSIFRGNAAAADGGGIDNTGSILDISSSTIQGNTAVSAGGVFNEPGGSISMFQSTIAGNRAEEAGGVQNALSATLTLENSTLSGNTASINAGGLEANGPVTVSESTLANNGAPTGGALTINAGVTVVLTDTLLAYSPSGGNCSGAVTRAVFSTSSDNTCGLTFLAVHNHDGLDPLLTGLGNCGGPTLVHMLKHNSPVLNSVIGNGPTNFDQRGQPRPGATSGWDPGAVERQLTDSDLAPWVFLPLARR